MLPQRVEMAHDPSPPVYRAPTYPSRFYGFRLRQCQVMVERAWSCEELCDMGSSSLPRFSDTGRPWAWSGRLLIITLSQLGHARFLVITLSQLGQARRGSQYEVGIRVQNLGGWHEVIRRSSWAAHTPRQDVAVRSRNCGDTS